MPPYHAGCTPIMLGVCTPTMLGMCLPPSLGEGPDAHSPPCSLGRRWVLLRIVFPVLWEEGWVLLRIVLPVLWEIWEIMRRIVLSFHAQNGVKSG